MRNLTPRAPSAANSRRSAGVSAKSSTAESSVEAFFGRQFETSERVIDISGVEVGMFRRHLVRPAPQRFRMLHPRLLLERQLGQRIERVRSGVHVVIIVS